MSQIPILNTKTQNIFCCVNENLMTFLYTLNRGDKKIEGEKVFFFGVYKKVVLVFSIRIWYLAYPTDRTIIVLSSIRVCTSLAYIIKGDCTSLAYVNKDDLHAKKNEKTKKKTYWSSSFRYISIYL